MHKKIVWVFVTCLMVLTLIISSCGSNTTTTTGGTVTSDSNDQVVITESDTPTTSGGTTTGSTTTGSTTTGGDMSSQAQYADRLTPKYGGTFIRIRTGDVNTWDYAAGRDMFTVFTMGEEMLGGDWKRGPAGTNENDWSGGFAGFISFLTGKLADSWEMPDDSTLLYHLHPGIQWWDKAPANGREMTADDIVWNLNRTFSEKLAYLYNSYTTVGKNPIAYEAVDKYTVKVTVKPETQGLMATVVGDFAWNICPDAVEANGGEPITDFHQFIGTGPFMIKDYVTSSVINYERNPNYWMADPLHPENMLPYPDACKELIVPDTSSQQAAFRTGKIDLINLANWEDVGLMQKQHPEVLVKSSPASSISMIWPRLDNKELPFNDIKIRYAMNYAVNQKAIQEDYYGGNADLLGWPYPDLPVFSAVYTPLDQQPQIVQDLFTYNPDKAKELLAEAGYPDGFKFTVDCASIHTDYLSIYKEYLAQVGIDMELSNLEWSVYLSVWMGGTYKDALYANDYVGNAYRMMCMSSASIWNYSRWNNPKTEEAVTQINEYLGKDDTKVAQVMKDIGPWELEQAVPIYMPSPYQFVMWWPWLQDFYGATGGGGYSNLDEYINFIWMDKNMKAGMGY